MSTNANVVGANPLGRILALVDRFRMVPSTTTATEGWANIFQCESASITSISYELQKFVELTAAARQAIQTHIRGNHTLYLAPLDRIEKMLSTVSFNHQWNAYNNYIDAETLTALRFGDDLLKQTYPAASPGAFQQISDYIARLDDLLRECLDSELSPEIKKLFIKHLEAIRAALLEYRVGGPDEVEATLDRALGSVMRHADQIKEEPSSTAQLVKKFVETISTFNELVSFTQNMVSFSPVAVSLLSHLKS